MKCILALVTLLSLSGCANSEYRFEQLDGDHATVLPLKLEGFYGLRDGAVVNAEARFADDRDAATMKIVIFLRPPAEFRSGTYQATIGGVMTSGVVECPSLTFLGGQTALPNVGGLFLFKDEQGHPKYRARIPVTMLTRRND